MSDKFMRHFIAIVGTLIAVVIYMAGYGAGRQGWWWAAIAVAIVYVIVYKLVDA